MSGRYMSAFTNKKKNNNKAKEDNVAEAKGQPSPERLIEDEDLHLVAL